VANGQDSEVHQDPSLLVPKVRNGPDGQGISRVCRGVTPRSAHFPPEELGLPSRRSRHCGWTPMVASGSGCLDNPGLERLRPVFRISTRLEPHPGRCVALLPRGSAMDPCPKSAADPLSAGPGGSDEFWYRTG